MSFTGTSRENTIKLFGWKIYLINTSTLTTIISNAGIMKVQMVPDWMSSQQLEERTNMIKYKH